MKLLYLSADNLRNGPFIKDLVYHFKHVGKCILLHDHFGSERDTRFVTKRISALMSEEMILNNAFSGDQRGIFTQVDGAVSVRDEFLQAALQTVDLIILNPLGLASGEVQALDALQALVQLRAAFGVEEVHLFPKNTRSHMVAQRRHLQLASDIAPLIALYEEEAAALECAAQLLPVVLGAPSHFKVMAT